MRVTRCQYCGEVIVGEVKECERCFYEGYHWIGDLGGCWRCGHPLDHPDHDVCEEEGR